MLAATVVPVYHFERWLLCVVRLDDNPYPNTCCTPGELDQNDDDDDNDEDDDEDGSDCNACCCVSAE